MSESYIVSARKYRPQTFDTVVGQEHITTTLKNAIKNQHLAHAFLFCGPRGVGKTTCARILARTINCESPTADMEACGVCNTCRSLKDNASFNVFELDAASNNSVDDIRDLTSQVRFAPQNGKYKVYIIDEVHMLSTSAFNAFLKTLEEPPPYAIFILATTEKHKILPTILSRCQIFDFKRITTHDITAHLQSIAAKEGMVANEAALHVIAQKSEGCMRDALSMLDRIASFTNGMLTYANTMEHLNLLDADYYFNLTDAMLCQDVASAMLHLDKALEKGFEGDVIIGGLAEHFRNLLLCKDARMAKLLDVPGEHKPLYYEKANQMPPSFVVSALNVLNDCELNYRQASNRRLHVEMCIIRLCYLLQFVNADTATGLAPAASPANSAEQEKKNYSPQPAPVAPQPQAAPATVKPQPTPVAPTPQATSAPAAPVEQVKPQTAPPAQTVARPAPPPASSSKKVSLSLLDDLDAQIEHAASQVGAATKELTADLAAAIFEQFMQQLLADDKSVLYSQFTLMKHEVFPPDEVRISSPDELTDTYARDQRNVIIDFFREKTGLNVRVTTEVREDMAPPTEHERVLTKSEMYEAMAAKNPNLARLKEGGGLTLEY